MIKTLKTYCIMRVYLTEAEKLEGKPAYETVLDRLRDREIAGATVYRGMAGYGPHCVLHTEKILRLSDDLPLVVEAIDSPEKIASMMEEFNELLPDHWITMQEVRAF